MAKKKNTKKRIQPVSLTKTNVALGKNKHRKSRVASY